MLNIVKLIPVVAAAAFMLCACGEKPKKNDDAAVSKTADIFAMDTYMSLKAYGGNAQPALDEAKKRITELEAELSVTSETSDISRLNSEGQAEIGEDALLLINKAIEMGGKTGGSLDITLYPVLKSWGFTTGEYRVPADSELEKLLENVDYSAIEISGNTVTLPENFQIDLGSLAKGYTGDEVMDIMQENGVNSAIISLGGNVQALGSKPDGSDWNVAVVDPFAPESNMCVLTISDKAVITSGNYERYFTGEDGQLYWHILDPADGRPADNGLVSVTVIGSSGLDCDALSTALFVMGSDRAVDYWKNDGSFEMILVSGDGEISYTQGLEGSFENVSAMPAEVIVRD